MGIFCSIVVIGVDILGFYTGRYDKYRKRKRKKKKEERRTKDDSLH